MKLPGASLEQVHRIYGSEGDITEVSPAPDDSCLTIVKQNDGGEILLSGDELEILIDALGRRLGEVRWEEQQLLKSEENTKKALEAV